jgi:hypothetical protein
MHSIEYIAFSILVINSLLWIILLYHLMNNTLQYDVLLSTIMMWTLWLLRELPLSVRRWSFLWGITCVILAIVMSIIIQRLLIINFALV